MAVKIRLMRIGTNNRPFYRVVAVDERRKRTGGYLDLLGTYNPLTEPKEINLDQNKIDSWIKKGAQPSYGFLRIIGKAPQRAPRKPKKAPKEAPAAAAEAVAPAATKEAAAEPQNEVTEQAPAENAPTEEQTAVQPEEQAETPKTEEEAPASEELQS
jgi:small subunit ribosomal protein S16